jgi:tRNA pseudouridine38-40 synthase
MAGILSHPLVETPVPGAPRHRIALCVEYDGSAFSGWQSQLNPRLATVQESLEQALSRIAAQPVKVSCAGRTDAGVHGSGQIVHFETDSVRPLKAWVAGTNSMLPQSISVHWAKTVPDDFHARFSALSRRYRYCIYNAKVRPALLASYVTVHHQPLDAAAMHSAGQLLLGEHDFTSYRGTACQSNTAMRNVMTLSVTRQGPYVVIDIEANAFLLHMVRNITGVLMLIGEGRKPPLWAAELLKIRDRTQAAVTAPPQGLCLYQVRYPERFGLPGAPGYFLPVFSD